MADPTDNTENASPAASGGLPRSVLFACNLNSVRSPMAAALAVQLMGEGVFVDSVGVYAAGDVDGFAAEVMREAGLNIDMHRSKTFADIDPGGFDLIVGLTPEAVREAHRVADANHTPIEYWPTANPADTRGSRSQVVSAFRDVRDALTARIKERLVSAPAA